jgi:hypothetical protein
LKEKFVAKVSFEVRPAIGRVAKDIMDFDSLATYLKFFSQHDVFLGFIRIDEYEFSLIILHICDFSKCLKNGSDATSTGNE